MNCVRSPNSARNTTANAVPATGQKPSRTPSRPVSSSSSSSVSPAVLLVRHNSTAPARNAAAVAAATARCGSRLSAPPAATASVTCAANAAAAPANTNAGRYLLLRIRQASTVLSGSSAGSTARKAVSAAVRFIGALRVSVSGWPSRTPPGEPGTSGPAACCSAEGLTQAGPRPRGR